MKNNQRTRREIIKGIGAAASLPFIGQLPLLTGSLTSSQSSAQVSSQPNVLFISVDDLNDFISPLNGYSQVITPNFERLAQKSLIFKNAYTAFPECSASRSSFMTGIAPYRSKVLAGNILDKEIYAKTNIGLSSDKVLQTLPRYFKSKGYKTIGGGKLYHSGFGFAATPFGSSTGFGNFDANSWDNYSTLDFGNIAIQYPGQPNYRDERFVDSSTGVIQGTYSNLISKMVGAKYNSSEQEAQMPDKLLAQWAEQQMKSLNLSYQSGSTQPFFMGVGFYRPHMAFYVPQRFYDMYPLDMIRTQNFVNQIEDLKDVPDYAIQMLLQGDQEDIQKMSLQNNRNGSAQVIQAYLASVSFVDECLGQLLSALERYGLMTNTIITLTSDHGWFLGEKLGWRKFKNYERATRVPMMISVPGGPKGVSTNQIASTLDLFPTLIDYTGGLNNISVDFQNQLDGKSLKSILDSPNNINKDSYAISTFAVSEVPATATNALIPAVPFYTLRTARWRYSVYPVVVGGRGLSEELFDLNADPTETRNLLYWDPVRYTNIRLALREILSKRVGSI